VTVLHCPSEFMHNISASSIIYLATVDIVAVQSAVDRSSTIFVEDLEVPRERNAEVTSIGLRSTPWMASTIFLVDGSCSCSYPRSDSNLASGVDLDCNVFLVQGCFPWLDKVFCSSSLQMVHRSAGTNAFPHKMQMRITPVGVMRNDFTMFNSLMFGYRQQTLRIAQYLPQMER